MPSAHVPMAPQTHVAFAPTNHVAPVTFGIQHQLPNPTAPITLNSNSTEFQPPEMRPQNPYMPMEVDTTASGSRLPPQVRVSHTLSSNPGWQTGGGFRNESFMSNQNFCGAGQLSGWGDDTPTPERHHQIPDHPPNASEFLPPEMRSPFAGGFQTPHFGQEFHDALSHHSYPMPIRPRFHHQYQPDGGPPPPPPPFPFGLGGGGMPPRPPQGIAAGFPSGDPHGNPHGHPPRPPVPPFPRPPGPPFPYPPGPPFPNPPGPPNPPGAMFPPGIGPAGPAPAAKKWLPPPLGRRGGRLFVSGCGC